MNPDEASIVLRLVGGYWPTPAMGQDETDAWLGHLRDLDFDDACEVAEMVATAGRKFRPGAGEFVAEYRTKTARPKGWGPVPIPAGQLEGPRNPCGHPNDRVACKDTVRQFIATCKDQLARAYGPLAPALALPRAGENHGTID